MAAPKRYKYFLNGLLPVRNIDNTIFVVPITNYVFLVVPSIPRHISVRDDNDVFLRL